MKNTNDSYNIPFNRPTIVGKELYYISQSIFGGHSSGDGNFTMMCHDMLERELGVPKVLLTPSCTHALEMAALLLDIKPGDEVIVPSFTFVSTINAFVLRGAKPIFVDIRKDTLNLDENQLEDLITPNTKAVLVVHYAGVGCNMDAINEIAESYGLKIIEDNAHGLFGIYKGRHLGSFGTLATQSFHETKNFTCGEGGALLINDERYIERAEIIREKGTNRNSFFRGQVDKYTWVDIGSSYLLSDILAAFLFAQLEAREEIQVKRKWIWETYHNELTSWAEENNVRLPIVPDDCKQSFHMFYLLMPSLHYRQALIEHLKKFSILSVFHYQPLHLSKMGRSFGGQVGDCPVTENFSNRLLRLPFYNDLYEVDLANVISKIKLFDVK
jgi:dTDP-4-amino-4,6-dideoxygalactose transaminase